MFERFSESARHVIVLAQEEARALNHNYIGTEHLLLGLIREAPGVAAAALQDLGVGLADAQERVVAIVGRGDKPPGGHIPFTPRAKKVLELALRESVSLDSDYLGTEHLLLGLIREGEGVGAVVLRELSGGLTEAREAVQSRIAQGTTEPRRDGGARRLRRFSRPVDDRLQAENDRLRALLRRHGIDPDSA